MSTSTEQSQDLVRWGGRVEQPHYPSVTGLGDILTEFLVGPYPGAVSLLIESIAERAQVLPRTLNARLAMSSYDCVAVDLSHRLHDDNGQIGLLTLFEALQQHPGTSEQQILTDLGADNHRKNGREIRSDLRFFLEALRTDIMMDISVTTPASLELAHDLLVAMAVLSFGRHTTLTEYERQELIAEALTPVDRTPNEHPSANNRRQKEVAHVESQFEQMESLRQRILIQAFDLGMRYWVIPLINRPNGFYSTNVPLEREYPGINTLGRSRMLVGEADSPEREWIIGRALQLSADISFAREAFVAWVVNLGLPEEAARTRTDTFLSSWVGSTTIPDITQTEIFDAAFEHLNQGPQGEALYDLDMADLLISLGGIFHDGNWEAPTGSELHRIGLQVLVERYAMILKEYSEWLPGQGDIGDPMILYKLILCATALVDASRGVEGIDEIADTVGLTAMG